MKADGLAIPCGKRVSQFAEGVGKPVSNQPVTCKVGTMRDSNGVKVKGEGLK
jgi:hypothetical protein